MNTTEPPTKGNNHSNAALWITVIIEALMIIAIGSYQIYEFRRQSQALSEFSARQGEKIDRIITMLELYVVKKVENPAGTNFMTSEGIDKAADFLQKLKRENTNRPGATQER